jgi:replicative DNA helicase Mcm
MFAPDIIGHGPAKLGLLRSIVGHLVLPSGNANTSTDKGRELNKKSDGRVHTLFVGDPGTAKSSLLDEAIKVKPNSRKVSAPHASTKTISAIIEKEGEQYTLRLGAIPLSAGAICGVNEIAHFPPEDQGRLLDVMEEGRFPLDKHGQHYDIPCPTTIIGTANPIQGRWSDSEIAHTDEINLRNALVERFTQIYTFRDKEEKGFVKKMNQIRKRKPSNYNFLIKYLVYASSIKDINITDEAEYMLNTFWDQAKSAGSLNVRMYLGIYRLAEAQAKLKLKNIIDEEIATQVIEAVQFMMSQFDKTGGTVKNPRDMTYCCFLQILQRVKMGITIPEICRIACEENTQVQEYLGRRWSVDQNMKLRRVVDMLLENSKVKRVNAKPTVLMWESDTYDTYDTDANTNTNQYSNR